METDELSYTPEETDVPEGVGSLYCFIDAQRVCGADCMGFVTLPRGGSPEMNAAQARCLLLSSLERTGRNITIVASLLAKKDVDAKRRAADEARLGQVSQSVKSPFGGK